MTVGQYQVLLSAVRGVSERVDLLYDRFAFQFPTLAEADSALHAELDEITRTAACGVEPFAAPAGLDLGLHHARLARLLAKSEGLDAEE